MHTQLHMALEIQDLQAENLLMNVGDFSTSSCSLMEVNNQKPAKKPTRQWAAWTRQEEENFFNALRQVGKNFEEITCQVQSKNRNQVRHYYYRLVRRMNKLLGPGLCLDAKNSKDTNAAMLRWWSLLEKHSCTASKLHLKPRRFKMFIEALENQLLKDRNKSRRKRPCQGDKYFSAASITSVPSKELGNDGHPVVDSPNTQKIEANKGPSSKRSTSKNTNFSKGELPPPRPARQKRRPVGLVASAAYKRWEKAAIAGVSLVADAAEQLERATNGGNCSVDQGTATMMSNRMLNNAGQKDIDSNGNSGGHLCSPTHHQTDNAVMQPSVKLKLQLFPIDEATRQALEKDACNPHLELTISGRKRISSILDHLNRKWGNSSKASGELMLFPYSAQQKGINQQGWTAKDITLSAADVYATVGSPAVFRLRYGWFSNVEPVMGIDQVPSPPHWDITMHSEDFQGGFDLDVPNGEKLNVELPIHDVPTGHISELPSGQEVSLGTRNILSAGDWADSLTNISIGDLLSEASKAAKSSCVDPFIRESIHYPQENPFSCDSFDAAIAAHTSRISTQDSPTSMWNADETCDEFSFQKAPVVKSRESSFSQFTEDNRQATVSNSLFQSYFKELTKTGSSNDPSCGNVEVELEPAKDASFDKDKDDPPKDANFMDIYWPDSLGPLDLEMPSASRFQGQDLAFGDGNSFGCLGRTISNSLDAFQNCSFFGTDKKE